MSIAEIIDMQDDIIESQAKIIKDLTNELLQFITLEEIIAIMENN